MIPLPCVPVHLCFSISRSCLWRLPSLLQRPPALCPGGTRRLGRPCPALLLAPTSKNGIQNVIVMHSPTGGGRKGDEPLLHPPSRPLPPPHVSSHRVVSGLARWSTTRGLSLAVIIFSLASPPLFSPFDCYCYYSYRCYAYKIKGEQAHKEGVKSTTEPTPTLPFVAFSPLTPFHRFPPSKCKNKMYRVTQSTRKLNPLPLFARAAIQPAPHRLSPPHATTASGPYTM